MGSRFDCLQLCSAVVRTCLQIVEEVLRLGTWLIALHNRRNMRTHLQSEHSSPVWRFQGRDRLSPACHRLFQHLFRSSASVENGHLRLLSTGEINRKSEEIRSTLTRLPTSIIWFPLNRPNDSKGASGDSCNRWPRDDAMRVSREKNITYHERSIVDSLWWRERSSRVHPLNHERWEVAPSEGEHYTDRHLANDTTISAKNETIDDLLPWETSKWRV